MSETGMLVEKEELSIITFYAFFFLFLLQGKKK